MTAAHAGSAMTTDRVDLIDENDTGRIFLALVKEVAYPGGTDAHEHLHEVRAGNGEERHIGLARGCAR